MGQIQRYYDNAISTRNGRRATIHSALHNLRRIASQGLDVDDGKLAWWSTSGERKPLEEAIDWKPSSGVAAVALEFALDPKLPAGSIVLPLIVVFDAMMEVTVQVAGEDPTHDQRELAALMDKHLRSRIDAVVGGPRFP